MVAKAKTKTVTIELVRSGIGRPERHKRTLTGLGLTKMHRRVTLEDTPAVRGMIRQVSHLVKVIEE